ncbi:hypothetical protein RFI_16175, partial [Reticulomyxa filosa]
MPLWADLHKHREEKEEEEDDDDEKELSDCHIAVIVTGPENEEKDTLGKKEEQEEAKGTDKEDMSSVSDALSQSNSEAISDAEEKQDKLISDLQAPNLHQTPLQVHLPQTGPIYASSLHRYRYNFKKKGVHYYYYYYYLFFFIFFVSFL